jgi:hypothetical protein
MPILESREFWAKKVRAIIEAHYETLDQSCGLHWKHLPAFTTLQDIIQGTSSEELEKSFRAYSQALAHSQTTLRCLAWDGKALRGSFDRFQDQKALQ